MLFAVNTKNINNAKAKINDKDKKIVYTIVKVCPYIRLL